MSKSTLIIGNSDGIGAAVAKALVERRERVVGVSRSESSFVDQNLRHEVCDVTSRGYTGVLRRLLNEEDGFGACVYCVGIGSGLTLPDMSNEAHVFEVNLVAMIRTLEVLVPHWLERGNGHFIGLSSLADAICNVDGPSYSASKAAFTNYLLSMALKLRGTGVSVTNIRFGFVDTKMAKASRKPLMMTTAEAGRHVLKCLEERPIQLSVPKLMAVAACCIGLAQSIKVWTS